MTRDPEVQRALRERIRRWLRGILDERGVTATALARQVGVAPSTFLRFLNARKPRFTPTLRTLSLVAQAIGRPLPDFTVPLPGEPDATVAPRDDGPVVAGGATPTAPDRDVVPSRFSSTLPARFHPLGSSGHAYPRPASMRGDPTAFACVIPDDGLGPVFQAGTVAYGTLSASPRRCSVVLVEWRDGRSAIRVVANVDDTGIEVSRIPGDVVERIDFDLLAFVGVLKVFERP